MFGDDVNAVGESGGYVRRGTVFEVRGRRERGAESADDDKSYELFLASRKRCAEWRDGAGEETKAAGRVVATARARDVADSEDNGLPGG